MCNNIISSNVISKKEQATKITRHFSVNASVFYYLATEKNWKFYMTKHSTTKHHDIKPHFSMFPWKKKKYKQKLTLSIPDKQSCILKKPVKLKSLNPTHSLNV